MKKFCCLGLLFSAFQINANFYSEDVIRQLNGKIEELEHRLEIMEKRFIAASTTPEENGETEKIAEQNLERLTPQDVIEEAKKNIKSGKYAETRALLSAFVKKYPKDIHCGMAQYYIGESHYSEKNYEKAAEFYIESFGTNPGGAKAPEALYYLAVCFKELGKIAQSKMTLDKLEREYPKNKECIDKAKKLRKELKN